MKIALLLRTFAIAFVALALLVPISLIEGKISERQRRADGVVATFAAETAGPEVVAGPFLALTCEETYTEEREIKRDGKAQTVTERKTRACPTGYFPPRTLDVVAQMPVESLYRGIYRIRTYRATLDFSGDVEWPAPPASTPTFSRGWKKAYYVISVSDPRGIRSATTSTSTSLSRNVEDGPDRPFAIQEALGDYDARKKGDASPFGFRVQLASTGSLHVAPIGDTTQIRISSDWPHPSFSGGWSPDERSVAPQGFRATWRTTHLATGGQALWDSHLRNNKIAIPQNAAGVNLFDPVNVYTLSYRATEYAFLFILFTFAALALVETLSGLRLHPIQYALVGSAIAVFFLLLIALSEHIHFSRAYAGAATACVLLISAYLRPALRTWGRTLAMTALFSGLYAGLYVMLSSEDNALLLGSLMVFVLLAVTMISTRKLDWAQFPFFTKPTIASTNGLATGNAGSE